MSMVPEKCACCTVNGEPQSSTLKRKRRCYKNKQSSADTHGACLFLHEYLGVDACGVEKVVSVAGMKDFFNLFFSFKQKAMGT